MFFDEDGRISLSETLKPFKPRPVIERSFMTDAEIVANAGSTLFFDVESFSNYFMCGFKHHATGKFIRLDGDFNPQFLSWLLHSYKTVGFNTNRYDLPILWAAYHNRNPAFLKEVGNALIQTNDRPVEIAKAFNFKLHKLPELSHIDLFEVCPLKGSLKLYGARIHTPRIQDLPIAEDKKLTADEIEIIVNYNYDDLDLTHQLFDFCKERLELRASMSAEYHEDLMSKSDAQIAETVIPKMVGKLNGKRVQRPDIAPGTLYRYAAPAFLMYATAPMRALLERVRQAEFIVGEDGKIIPPVILNEPVQIGKSSYSIGIGGLHSKDKCKAYVAKDGYKIRDVDVTSYYPNAILNMNLFPIALGENFITVFRGFKDARVSAKVNKQFTKDKGLKIFLNGMSGKFSDVYSKMYSPGNTIQMNLTGQLSILMLAEMFECQGMEVISANTDGLTVYYKKEDGEKISYWCRQWEQMTNFNLEDVQYRAYYARDVNAYFAVKDDGKVKIKGPWSETGSQSGTQLDTNPNMLICTDAIEAFLSKGADIEKTIRECTNLKRFVIVQNVRSPGASFEGEYLGKVVRYYKSKTSQSCIRSVGSGNKVPNSDGARPVLDLPTVLPDDLDYQFYIDKCTSILYDIGYLSKPKQISFF